jgi:hypothetical protein
MRRGVGGERRGQRGRRGRRGRRIERSDYGGGKRERIGKWERNLKIYFFIDSCRLPGQARTHQIVSNSGWSAPP